MAALFHGMFSICPLLFEKHTMFGAARKLSKHGTRLLLR